MQPNFLICVPLHSSIEVHDIFMLATLAKAIESNGRSAQFYLYEVEENGTVVQGIDINTWSGKTDRQARIGDAIKRVSHEFGIRLSFDTAPEYLNACYVVYPEVELNNLLNAKRVIRYFLHRDGLTTQGRRVDVGPNDFILARSKHAHPAVQHVSLSAHLSSLFNRTDTLLPERRQLDITYIGRGAQFGIGEPLSETVEITDEWLNNDQQLAALLRNCRFFYTADALSQLNFVALACGAIPAFLDDIGPFADTDIDGSELGLLPRLQTGCDIGANFFGDFEVAREAWLGRLHENIGKQNEDAAQMIVNIDLHFVMRLPDLRD